MKLKTEIKTYFSLTGLARQGWATKIRILFAFSFIGYIMQNYWANYLFAACKSDLYNFLLLGKGNLTVVLGRFAGSYAVFTILLAFSFWGLQAVSSYSSMLLKRRIFHRYLHTGEAPLQKEGSVHREDSLHSGKMYQYLNQDVDALSFLTCNGFANFFLPYVAGIGAVFTVVAGANAWFLVPVLLMSLVEIVLTKAILPRRKVSEEAAKANNDRLMETITNQISGIEALKTASFFKLALASFYQDTSSYAQARKNTNRWDARLGILKAATRSVAYVSCFILGSGILLPIEVEIGDVILAAGMAPLIQSMLCNLWSNWGDLQAAMVSGLRLQELLGQEQEKKQTKEKQIEKNQIKKNQTNESRIEKSLVEKKGIEENCVEEDGKEQNRQKSGLLKVEDLRIAYSGKTVVEHLSFQVKAGELVALIGQSGSGKSTIIRAISGQIPIEDGTIFLCGKNIKRLDKEEQRNYLAYMPQGGDTAGGSLFPTTIRDNIALGMGNPALATDQRIEEAAKLAGIWDDIKQLPEQVQTIVGEKGISLSGGQVERVLLARTLLRQAPVLLLDEPTASLDEETEARFLKQLRQLVNEQQIGVLVATHRKKVVEEADTVIKL